MAESELQTVGVSEGDVGDQVKWKLKTRLPEGCGN